MRPMLWVMILSSCASVPHITLPVEHPKGALCTHKASLGIAFCTDLETGLPIQPIPINETDHWILFSPGSYQSVKNYLDQLEANATL